MSQKSRAFVANIQVKRLGKPSPLRRPVRDVGEPTKELIGLAERSGNKNHIPRNELEAWVQLKVEDGLEQARHFLFQFVEFLDDFV